MYGNNFFNPYMYQPYYQVSNLANGFGNMSRAGNLGRAMSGFSGAASGLRRAAVGSGFGSATNGLGASMNGASVGGLKGLLGKFSFSGFLNGASKTLNVVNQAIPIFYQVKPMFNNARTMFRIMGAVRDDSPSNVSVNRNNTNTVSSSNNNVIVTDTNSYQEFNEENPAFFI